MLGLLASVLGAVFSFLGSVLPDSPFSGLSLALGVFGDALGWLNWLVPFGPMGLLLGGWLVAALGYRAARYAMRYAVGRAAGAS